MACEAMFQSPLIGASVMTEMSNAVTVLVVFVSIPSDRGFCNDPNDTTAAAQAINSFNPL